MQLVHKWMRLILFGSGMSIKRAVILLASPRKESHLLLRHGMRCRKHRADGCRTSCIEVRGSDAGAAIGAGLSTPHLFVMLAELLPVASEGQRPTAIALEQLGVSECVARGAEHPVGAVDRLHV